MPEGSDLTVRCLKLLPSGYWLTTLEAAQFVQIMERRQGIKIACLEEIALKNNWINSEKLLDTAKKMKNSEYGKYLNSLVNFLVSIPDRAGILLVISH